MVFTVEDIIKRKEVLEIASGIAGQILEKFPPEVYKLRPMPSGPFTLPSESTVTTAEQALSLTIDVANWLLGEQ